MNWRSLALENLGVLKKQPKKPEVQQTQQSAFLVYSTVNKRTLQQVLSSLEITFTVIFHLMIVSIF